MSQPDPLQQLLGPSLVRPLAGEPHGQKHVFQRGESTAQIKRLEHVADMLGAKAVALGLGHQADVHVVDPHLALIRPADSGDDVQERCLSAPAGTDQHHLFAGTDMELWDIQDRQRAAVRLAKCLFYIFERQHDCAT